MIGSSAVLGLTFSKTKLILGKARKGLTFRKKRPPNFLDLRPQNVFRWHCFVVGFLLDFSVSFNHFTVYFAYFLWYFRPDKAVYTECGLTFIACSLFTGFFVKK